MAIEQTRHALLEATLPHVPFDGWTGAAVTAGARNLGLSPAEVANAFPGGPIEMIELMSLEADQRMLEALEREDLASMKVRERVALAVRRRLELYVADREAVRRALAMLALPHNSVLALRLLYRTVDGIWYAAGDTATDFNFYTKRALLAGVYSATVLYWLNDKSAGAADTWAFLNRRIDEVMQVPKLLGKVSAVTSRFPNPFRVAQRVRPRGFRARTARG
jgi:ubiquinone biosynthesis protein COQ9